MPRTILIVDDIMSNRLIIKQMLDKDYAILEADCGETALDILEREHERISAVLLDISMPGMDGYEVLTRIRANKEFSLMPVIMITGSESNQTRVKSLALGANDFVMKPYSSEILKHCLQNNIAFREAAATVSAMQRDKLTGLYSRESFFDKVRELVAEHEPGYYIMACFDIDKFKVINDQYGVQKGDEVLLHTANVFREGFEPHGGICCRANADNFAVLYPASFQYTDEIVAIRERASHVEGLVTPLRFSIGRYKVDDVTMPPFSMYDRATLAANTVKGRYDVNIAVYDETMREHLIREQEIVSEMEGALRQRQFEVWFQPQYNHSTSAMVGAEALVRWRHPQRGLIPPYEFIPVFEQNGFIYSLDKFVWEEVCRLLRKWIDENRSPLPVSVNISRNDIFVPDMVDTLLGITRKYDLPLDMLRLEVTESAFAKDSAGIISVVKRLIDLGFTVEIDDFGSGYSSLNTLKDVPAQIIKLDMRFLDDSDDSQRGGNIVESVVRMAKWLGMSVIAEGVETIEQANYLRSIGCYYIQGYLYAKPMPAAMYEEHCDSSQKEERLLKLETVDNLDNNAFWDPKSMDTLIFNSFVGGACIYEFNNGKIELLRATEKYAQVLGSAGMTVEDALKMDWAEHLDEENSRRVVDDIMESVATKKEVTGEYIFHDLPGCPRETYLRSSMRVIAATGNRYLVYCTNENITAQRQSEERERLAAEQLSAIMQNIQGGVTASIVDGDKYRRLFANDTYYRLLGYTRERYEELSDGSLIGVPPEDRKQLMAKAREISATGGTGSMEYRIIRPDGETRWISSNISVISYPGESKPVQLAVTTDVTEQREAERKVRMVSEQMQAILDNVDIGIIAAVVEGENVEYLFANDHYFDMLGYTKERYAEEIETPFQIIDPEDRQMMRDGIAKINETGQSAVLIYHVNTGDGRKRVIRATISLGSITGIDKPVQFSILRDITEERETQRRESFFLEQLKSMMDDMPGGFARMRVEPDGSISTTYVNEGLQKLFGMSHDEVMDIYANDALAGVHPDDIDIVNDVIKRMLENGEAESARYRLKHGNGGYVWLSIFGRVTKDSNGDTYMNVYYTDATEQVKEEEAQKALLDNLPGGAGIYEFMDGQMALIYQNRSFWDVVGMKPGSIRNPVPMSAIHPDDMPIVMGELFSAIEHKRDVVCDIRMHHLTKGYRNVHLVGRIVPKDEGGYTIYTTFTPSDIDGVTYQQMLPLVLSAIMDSTSDLSFAKDKNFVYLTSSRAFANMVGLKSEQDVIGKTDYDLFDKALADKFRRDDEMVIKSGKAIIDMQESIPSDDGSPHYSSTSKYILRDGSGEVIGLYGVGRDITKSVARDTQLRLVNDSVPGGLATYCYKDGALSIIYCNDGFCRLFGGTREGLEKRGDFDHLSWVMEKDRPELLKQINSLVDDGAAIDCLFRIHTLDGGYKWINQKAVVTERTEDAVLFNTILIDVTERQNALEMLRISEEENTLAMRLGGTIVMRYIVADRSLNLLPEIAAAYKLPERIVDVPYEPVRQGLISPESVNAYVGFFEAIMNGSEAGAVMYRQKYLGDWRWMEAKGSTIFADDGKPVKAVISVADVTDRLEKERVYMKWQSSLEERPPESYTLFRLNLNRNMSYDSREGTLVKFNFDAEGASFNERAQRYCESCVCPDDRDNYTSFVNSDAMLAGYYRGKRSDTLEYRELTEDGGVRWLRLTVDLVEYPNSNDVEAYLMYEDIDQPKREELLTKERSETDPLTGLLNRSTFAAKVDGILRASGQGERHALFMLDIDNFKHVNDAFGHAVGDQALIDMANGLRTMTRRDDIVGRLSGDEFVLFFSGVKDDSTAIAKAKQIRAFARRSYSMEVQISASIGVAFAPGDGTDFKTLYEKADAALYYVKGSGKDNQAIYKNNMEEERLVPEPDALDASGTRLADKKRRMLIVEDSSIDYEMLKFFFRDEFIVEKAKDGNSALIQLHHYGPAISVVLLDLKMPGMDGFSVLEKIRESVELRSIPVIIVSGDESRDTCLEAIRRGANDFITKPVDEALLRLRVHSAISKAENERLRTKNSILEVQNEERIRYESALEGTGITFVEYNSLKGEFAYYPSISRYLLGTYDDRAFWQILLSDKVTDARTAGDIQLLVHRVAGDSSHMGAGMVVSLKTPQNVAHRFRMTVRRLVKERHADNRIIITLDDLDYEGAT